MPSRPARNEIVVYQPNETVRLEVRVENETVWLTQSRIGELFGVDRTSVVRHVRNIYATGELDESSTCAKIAQVQLEGGRTVSRVVPFYNLDGQLWDACSLVERLVARAKTSIRLIDGWVGPGTLDMLAKKRSGVAVEIVTSSNGKLAATDIDKFNAQYPTLSVRVSTKFHDRFLILDDKELYHVGASLKDLGRKCFAFSTMEPSLIPAIKSRL